MARRHRASLLGCRPERLLSDQVPQSAGSEAASAGLLAGPARSRVSRPAFSSERGPDRLALKRLRCCRRFAPPATSGAVPHFDYSAPRDSAPWDSAPWDSAPRARPRRVVVGKPWLDSCEPLTHQGARVGRRLTDSRRQAALVRRGPTDSPRTSPADSPPRCRPIGPSPCRPRSPPGSTIRPEPARLANLCDAHLLASRCRLTGHHRTVIHGRARSPTGKPAARSPTRRRVTRDPSVASRPSGTRGGWSRSWTPRCACAIAGFVVEGPQAVFSRAGLEPNSVSGVSAASLRTTSSLREN